RVFSEPLWVGSEAVGNQLACSEVRAPQSSVRRLMAGA
ncbi:MAG: hypothetical protein RLY23_941, partial [Actinomycetota bacterium]